MPLVPLERPAKSTKPVRPGQSALPELLDPRVAKVRKGFLDQWGLPGQLVRSVHREFKELRDHRVPKVLLAQLELREQLVRWARLVRKVHPVLPSLECD